MGKPPLEIVPYSSEPFVPFRLKPHKAVIARNWANDRALESGMNQFLFTARLRFGVIPCFRIRGETIDDAGDAVADQFRTEVDQQPQPAVRQLEVSEELVLVNPVNLFDGLELDDDDIFHDQVRLKADFQLLTINNLLALSCLVHPFRKLTATPKDNIQNSLAKFELSGRSTSSVRFRSRLSFFAA
jgi:hypothetical protein